MNIPAQPRRGPIRARPIVLTAALGAAFIAIEGVGYAGKLAAGLSSKMSSTASRCQTRMKQDAIPGVVQPVWFTATETGEWR